MQEIFDIVHTFDALCTHLIKYQYVHRYMYSSICTCIHNRLLEEWEFLPGFFVDVLLKFFSKSSFINIIMHLYSFYLQVNCFKTGFAFEKWGPAPKNFSLPIPKLKVLVLHNDCFFTLDSFSFFCDRIVSNENPLPLGANIYIAVYPHIYNLYLRDVLHHAEPLSTFSFFFLL